MITKKVSNQCDTVPTMSDSPEQKRAKSGKVDLRKSLAWDNAFLTSEGVLDTEELGIVNRSFRKTGACSLSGIPEELRKSSESTSTLDGDGYSLASLGGDLFNLRAPIEMTVARHDNITNVEPTPSCLDTEKGVHVLTDKAKPSVALREVGTNKQQTDRTSKEAAIGVNEKIIPITKKVSNQCDPVPEKSDSPEQKRAKPGKVNMRKSLAWDNAFLTSEGVLDTEELGILNSSFRKAGACSLSGIPEELRKSTESTCTLDSDSYSLASLDGDLFNLRASIQMTVGRHDNITSVEPTPSCLDTEKGVHVPTDKAKPSIALRKVGMNKQQTDRTSNEAAIGVNDVKKGTNSSKLALKPPRVVPKSTSLSMHSKDSSAGLQMKINTKRTSSAVGSMSKTNGDSGNKTPRSIGLSKPIPSVKSLITTSTGSSITSPRENSRKRLATHNTDNSLSKSTAQTPTGTSKSRLGSSNHTTKLPPKSSPSSSTDSFASEVSSSSTSVCSIKPSNSVDSFTRSNSSSPSLVSNKHVSPNNIQRRVPNVKASLSFNTVPETSCKDNTTRASTNSNTGAKSFIPTGLRMPSPKIGYFDSEKSQVNSTKIPHSDVRRSQVNSTKIPHSDVRRSSMLKGTINNNNIGADKAKSSKIPSLKPTPKLMPTSSDSPYTRPSPIYKEDAQMENELNSSTLDKLQKGNELDSSKLGKVRKENELNSSSLDDAQKENLFPSCDTHGLNHDDMLEKMTALSISTNKDNVTDI